MSKKIGNIEINTPPEGYKSSLKSRLIVAGVLMVTAVPTFVLGGWPYFFAIMIFLLIAIAEVIKAPRKKYNWFVYVATYAIILSFVYWMFFKDNMSEYAKCIDNQTDFVFSLDKFYEGFEVSVIGIAVSLLVYCVVGILDKNFGLDDIAYFFFMSLLVGLGFQAFYFIRYYPVQCANSGFADITWGGMAYGETLANTAAYQYWGSFELLLFVFIGPIFNDIAAYFGGVYFGKHKLNERISPKKTWEGFYWGVIVGFVATAAFGLILAATGNPVLPFLTIDKWYWIVLIALLEPLFATIGDLSFSLIKRYYNIKDYGNILRGHGGILDRADSIIFSSIGAVIVLILIKNGWNFLI
ncbi:MAG: phosphatidate cytidylyltransferase [Bacilli bacterium]|nr:phosphatidate cytidylyltransferase [Bacilli bacterium]